MENETSVVVKELVERNARLVFSNVRVKWPQLFTPKSVNGGAERYGINLLIPKGSDTDKVVIQTIYKIAENAIGPDKYKEWLANLWGNSNKNSYRKDPVLEAFNTLACYRNAAQKGAPVVVDRAKRPLTIDSQVKPYGGCYCNVSADIYIQTKDNPGIRATLIAVQFLKDGDALGNDRPATADDFESLEDDGDANMFNQGEEIDPFESF